MDILWPIRIYIFSGITASPILDIAGKLFSEALFPGTLLVGEVDKSKNIPGVLIYTFLWSSVSPPRQSFENRAVLEIDRSNLGLCLSPALQQSTAKVSRYGEPRACDLFPGLVQPLVRNGWRFRSYLVRK